jgi:beta-lactamase class A
VSNIGDDFLQLIAPGDGVAHADLTRLADARLGEVSVAVLSEVLAGLRMSEVRINHVRDLEPGEVLELATKAPAGAVADVAVAEVVSRSGILADVFFTSTDSGALGGVRTRIDPPPIATPEHLRRALQCLDSDASVVARSGATAFGDRRVKAVASLVKIFILLATLDAVDGGRVRLEQQHVLELGDISPLSAGLTSEHAGARLTLAELCQLMMLRSDNSAADILLREVGPDAVAEAMERCGVDPALNRPVRTMREMIEAAWARNPINADGGLSRIAATEVVHRRGLDFYAPLDAVAEALERVSRSRWTPWPNLTASPLYKGGSAPGVLSAAWLQASGRSPRFLLFAVNADAPLGAVEELYAFTCAELLLARMGICPAAAGRTPYVVSPER